MTRLYLCVLFTFIALTGFSQSKYDSRLLEKYSDEELTHLKDNNPAEFVFVNYCLEHAFYITDLPKEKMESKNDQIGSIVLESLDKINFYALDIELIQDNYQFFAIEGHDKLLVIKSIDHIKKEMQNE